MTQQLRHSDPASAPRGPRLWCSWGGCLCVRVYVCNSRQRTFAVLETFQRRRGRGYCASKYLRVDSRAVSPDLLRKHRRVIKQAPNPTLACQKHCFFPSSLNWSALRFFKITCLRVSWISQLIEGHPPQRQSKCEEMLLLQIGSVIEAAVTKTFLKSKRFLPDLHSRSRCPTPIWFFLTVGSESDRYLHLCLNELEKFQKFKQAARPGFDLAANVTVGVSSLPQLGSRQNFATDATHWDVQLQPAQSCKAVAGQLASIDG